MNRNQLKLELLIEVPDEFEDLYVQDLLGAVRGADFQQMIVDELINGDNTCPLEVIDSVTVAVTEIR